MYIATKRWQASPFAQTSFPNFAAMPLPRLSVQERKEMEGLRECFDSGRVPGDMQDESPAKQPIEDYSNNNRYAGPNGAMPPPAGNNYNNNNGANTAPPAVGNNNNCCGHQFYCCGGNHAAGPYNGNNPNGNVQPGPANAPESESSTSSSSSSSESESESESEPEDPAIRLHKEWVDHAWFDIFANLYPPRRRFTADRFWSRRDCRILGIIESKYDGVKWDEFSAQFCNATGRYVPPEYIKYKMETDGVAIGPDDESESDVDFDDDFDEYESESSASSGE
ncbi:hypothetical protein PG988_015692 [Apiospora saccharicola]